MKTSEASAKLVYQSPAIIICQETNFGHQTFHERRRNVPQSLGLAMLAVQLLDFSLQFGLNLRLNFQFTDRYTLR